MATEAGEYKDHVAEDGEDGEAVEREQSIVEEQGIVPVVQSDRGHRQVAPDQCLGGPAQRIVIEAKLPAPERAAIGRWHDLEHSRNDPESDYRAPCEKRKAIAVWLIGAYFRKEAFQTERGE